MFLNIRAALLLASVMCTLGPQAAVASSPGYGGGGIWAGGGGGGARYPPGVSPQACPNYPFCNPYVDPKGYGGYGTYPSYQAGYHGGSGGAVAAAGHGYQYQPQPARYPASFDPASCPNYPFCHNNPGGGYGGAAGPSYAVYGRRRRR